MIQTEHKRVKHGEQPGEISRLRKIQLREMRRDDDYIYPFPWQRLDWKCAQSFRSYMKNKSKTVQRRRDAKACNEQF
jgi:hypothetical protein